MTKYKKLAVCVGKNVNPIFEHDCTQCKFIAQVDGHDAYVCVQSCSSSIVLRYGSHGPEYNSLHPDFAPEHSLYALVTKLDALYNEGLISKNKYVTRSLNLQNQFLTRCVG